MVMVFCKVNASFPINSNEKFKLAVGNLLNYNVLKN
jgi:hypothetical protein